MRLDTLVTSVLVLSGGVNVQQRQDTTVSPAQAPEATAPPSLIITGAPTATPLPTNNGTNTQLGDDIIPYICEDPCQAAGRAAQRVGKVFSGLCDQESDFIRALASCKACIKQNKPDPPNDIPPLLTSLVQYLDWCSVKVSEYYSSFVSSVAYCASYSYFEGGVPSNCSATTTISTSSPSSTFSISSSLSATLANATAQVPSPSPTETPRKSNTGAIAGGVVGGVAALALTGLLLFFVRRHRKHRLRPEETHEKAQLHADDIKPDRKELEGSKASRDLLEKEGKLEEMPANEEVEVRSKKLGEMPSNEPAGHEMETTEHEMRALDSLARNSGGTTLVSSAKSEGNSSSERT